MEIHIIYEDENLLVVEKPAGMNVYLENSKEKTLIGLISERFPKTINVGIPPRYGLVHRLDKETSGIVLIAKTNEALMLLQQSFKEGKVTKKYLALVSGKLTEKQSKVETVIRRSPKDPQKQQAFPLQSPEAQQTGSRKAVTEYKALSFFQDFTYVEVFPKTGRRHQIRCHFSYLGHPVAGDKLYSFKNQLVLENLNRHFLHASYLKISLPKGESKEFHSDLPEDLKNILNQLKS
ncbi:RluA family pseudouridine synthase [Patescibacteria group bacterium]